MGGGARCTARRDGKHLQVLWGGWGGPIGKENLEDRGVDGSSKPTHLQRRILKDAFRQKPVAGLCAKGNKHLGC